MDDYDTSLVNMLAYLRRETAVLHVNLYDWPPIGRTVLADALAILRPEGWRYMWTNDFWGVSDEIGPWMPGGCFVIGPDRDDDDDHRST